MFSSWFGSGRFAVLLATVVLCVSPLGAETPYTARIDGVDEPALLALLHGVSDTLAVEAEIPASLLHLRRRAEGDVEEFLSVFQSQGYYGAEVSLDLDRDIAPVPIVFRVETGPQYTLNVVEIRHDEGAIPLDLPAPEELGLASGAPALASAILAADAGLLEQLGTHGYPAPTIAKRDVVVDHATQTVDVTFHVQSGMYATYGAPDYEGLERTRPVVVDRLLPWKEGDPFDQRQLGELRTRLYETGLFATASAQALPGDIDASGAMPVRVTVTERPPRTISTGLEYKSDEGAGAHIDWEHRNMKGLGHDFGVNATLATELREIGLRYRINRFRRLDQDLGLSFRISQEEREAYDSERVDTLALVDRTVNPRLNISAGAGIRVGNVEQREVKSSYELIYFPVEARLDRSDDPLDPSRGFKFRARIEPYVDPLGDLRLFTKGEVEFSYYLGFGAIEISKGRTLPNWVLASRIRAGGIGGEELEDIPADVRFYGGGGGSIRGYRFQTVSPLDGEDPIGGRSLAEFSIELRRRISETLGIVAFVDGGGAFEAAWPDFGSDIQYGAGLGLRYYTPLGPMRFDVAVPLNKRDEIDDAFQIYLSIGHAF